MMSDADDLRAEIEQAELTYGEEIERLKAELAQLKSEIEGWSCENGLDGSCTKLKADLAAARAELAIERKTNLITHGTWRELETLKAELNSANEYSNACGVQIEQLKAERDTLVEKLTVSINEAVKFHRTLDAWRTECERLAGALEHLKEANRRLVDWEFANEPYVKIAHEYKAQVGKVTEATLTEHASFRKWMGGE